MIALVAFLASEFTVKHIDKYKTFNRWALVEVSGTKITYWQAVPPREQESVFDISDAQERQKEIFKRVQRYDEQEGNRGSCPEGMVHAAGELRDRKETISRQNRACEDRPWNPQYLCTIFDQAKLASPPRQRTRSLDYCIDRFEFPNIPGEYPGVLLSWHDGDKICRSQDKRLCTEDEWVFACEGPEALPYPHGYARYLDPRSRFPDRIVTGDGCNIDVIRRGLGLDASQFRKKESEGAIKEIDKLWAGAKSGERRSCVSPLGVYDLTGNIEEWTTRTGSTFRSSILRGGYWSPVENRCQPGNEAHGPAHAYYQTGFRCCAPANSSESI